MRESRRRSLDAPDSKSSKTETRRYNRNKDVEKKKEEKEGKNGKEEKEMKEIKIKEEVVESDSKIEDNEDSVLPTDMPSASRVCSSPTKSEDSEGNATDRSISSSNAGGESSQSSTSKDQNQYLSPTKKHGIAGIKFHAGLRLEAKDLGNDIWYAVKVVEVDWDEEEILIHFEKWSQRYDEWIPMDSSRLRPIQEPPGGFSKKNTKVFKVGDKVMATWSDSRKYPAKVKTVLANDRYEVLFFDGFSKNIKGGRMTLLKDEELANLEQLQPGIGPSNDLLQTPPNAIINVIKSESSESIGTKEERRERKRKLNVAELFHFKKRPRINSVLKSPLESGERRRRGGGFGRGRRKRHWSNQSGAIGDSSVFPVQVKMEPESPTKSESNFKSKEFAGENDRNFSDLDKKKEGVGKGRRRYSYKLNEEDKARGKSKNSESEHLKEGEKYSRKINRKLSRKLHEEGRKSPFPGSARKDKGSDETAITETPRGRKKDTFDRDSSKPSRTLLDDWEPEGEPAYIVDGTDGPRKSIIVPDKRIPPGWTRHTIQRMSGNSAGKWDVFFVCPTGRKFRTRHELRQYYEDLGEPFPSEQFDFSLGRRKSKAAASETSESGSATVGRPVTHGRIGRPPGSGKIKTSFVPGSDAQTPDQPVRRVKTLLPRVRPAQSDQCDGIATAGFPPECLTPTSTTPTPPPPLPLSSSSHSSMNTPGKEESGESSGAGGLKIQKENDAYKCPKEGCNKNFRKENLLQMHIKHYHPEYNRFVASTPNVADLAYARTIGEPVEDLMPRPPRSSFLDKISRFEAYRKAKAQGSDGMGECGNEGSPSSPPFIERKKQFLLGRRSKGDGEGSLSMDESAEDERNACQGETGVTGDNVNMTSREDIPSKPTIKTLLPVVRVPTTQSSSGPLERRKGHTSPDEMDDYIDVTALAPRQETFVEGGLPQESPTDLGLDTNPPVLNASFTNGPGSGVCQTKSLRHVRRRHMTDFHMEPLFKKRKNVKMPELLPEDVDVGTDENAALSDGSIGLGPSKYSSYRFSRKKLPVVHLEKLHITTDSNVIDECSKSPLNLNDSTDSSSRQTRTETLRREELINCTCGYPEEDGLMIQCDLCLCWQHGLCNSIEKEEDVPEKYVCYICLNPSRERKSKRYLHNQDWLKEGVLPSLSFRSKNTVNIAQREAILKRSHELTGTLLQLQNVIHSLRVKVNIAEKSDHPKLYLWSKSWEKNGSESVHQSLDVNTKQKNAKFPIKQEISELKTEKTLNEAEKDLINVLPKKETLSVLRDELDIPPPTATPEQGTGEVEEEGGKLEQSEGCEKIEGKSDTKTSVSTNKMLDSTSHDDEEKNISSKPDARQRESLNKIGSNGTTQNSELTEAVVLDGTMDIGTETEVATAGLEMDVEDEQPTQKVVDTNDDQDIKSGEERSSSQITNDASSEESQDNRLPKKPEDNKKELSSTSPENNMGTESHPELQLPICQSELMQLATSMVDKLESGQESVKVKESPRAPQPEAPIDPVECRLTLLDHIDHFHQQIESRLTSLEAQIAALESMDPYLANDEAADPQTKQTVQMLLRDLSTLRDIASLN